MSGGLDSAVVLHMILEKQIPVRAICFNYGQEAVKECEYAENLCKKLNVPFELLDISNLGLASKLGDNPNKELSTECIVPNRNAVFLSIATSYAIKYGCDYIYYGATGHRHPSYFDTQPEFIIQFNKLNKVSDINTVQLRAPLIYTHDYEVLDLGIEFGIDLTETWSCYRNGENPCGTCDMCLSKQSLSLEYLEDVEEKEYIISKQLASYENKIPEVKQLFDNDTTNEE